MDNKFEKEANRALSQGGLIGNLFMLKEYCDFSIVDDESMSPAEKLDNAIDLMQIECRHYEKRDRRNNIKAGILLFVSIVGAVALFFATIYLMGKQNDGALWTAVLLAFWMVFFTVFSSDVYNNSNRLVLFWMTYSEILLDKYEFTPEVVSSARRKIQKIYRAIS